MKKIFFYAIALCICINAFAQTETFDIATYTAPMGWQRMDSNGVRLYQDSKTVNGLTSFCQLYMYPSHTGSGNAAKDFKTEWDTRIVKAVKTTAKPKTQSEKTPDGWTVTSGYANIKQYGITYTCMLVTMTGFGKVMAVRINIAGQDYAAAIDEFFKNLNLDATAKTNNETNNTSSTTNTIAIGDFSSYSFTAPERWLSQRTKDYILLSQYQSLERGCLVFVYPPQQSASGNIETDAKNFFNQMYPGWQFRLNGENHDDLIKGYTPQGLEFCMVEAAMQKQRPDGYYYDYEKGSALVIDLGNKQEAVILSRHERGEMVCFCKYQYEYWPRFFNSFNVKIAVSSKGSASAARDIVGSWHSIGGSDLVKYIFAANGHYQFIGAYSTTTRISRDYIETRTSGFKGDGTYAIKGDEIWTTKDGKTDKMKFRLEKVNHGSQGWKNRLYILDVSDIDGKQYEVDYEEDLK